MKGRSLFILVVSCAVFATGSFSVPPARAGRVEPTSVSCWFFQGDKVELNQICIYENYSWAGGGVSSLRWEDGVKTRMAWGLQGRGEKPCPDTSIDGVCGVTYFRHPTTLKRISEEERQNRVRKSEQTISCVQAQNKSICWLR
jgi:hypothetical protein